ncbi:hypothetical protein [Cupriavidus oxalaticus]|uniref:Transmembrane lipoprotein n=1 Tax=Cupriavidus oxalaticus TaxID=96344 RepID=A0A976BEL8_9BURK|nr:hypothetical protein [Cupriavidus oxalaticus]QRQ86762.1 hypothetical protein JTE91_26635 [Cupriavidus oxalaticus]QRQ94910.1 hypothetical protein JTE92_15625 [Cupriavidus oxalaticus]WQD83563.1 hypothetical protein U0036_03315 [Cupriavidus oxalaticus]SPC16813.1 conserved exported hypothetical protein [Cupriavidus oxalaticus]
MNKTLKLSRGAAVLMLGSAACLALAGCMTSTPVWDGQRGVALATVTQMQIINPDAPAGLPTITGTDGKTAVAAMKNLDRSLVRSAQGNGTPGFTVDFGAGGYGGIGMSGGNGSR